MHYAENVRPYYCRIYFHLKLHNIHPKWPMGYFKKSAVKEKANFTRGKKASKTYCAKVHINSSKLGPRIIPGI